MIVCEMESDGKHQKLMDEAGLILSNTNAANDPCVIENSPVGNNTALYYDC
jgi:hypothetical protein